MDSKVKKQTIELTKKQFLALLKTAYLGNWIANAYRIDDKKMEYEKTEDLIFSHAPEFGFERFMDHEESDKERYYPTRYFEEETGVDRLHEEYDEESMWDELAERLGERDFFEKYSQNEIEKMSREEFFDKLTVCEDKYYEEFGKYGLDRIKISKDISNVN